MMFSGKLVAFLSYPQNICYVIKQYENDKDVQTLLLKLNI